MHMATLGKTIYNSYKVTKVCNVFHLVILIAFYMNCNLNVVARAAVLNGENGLFLFNYGIFEIRVPFGF